jgi:hypothetical protein
MDDKEAKKKAIIILNSLLDDVKKRGTRLLDVSVEHEPICYDDGSGYIKNKDSGIRIITIRYWERPKD